MRKTSNTIYFLSFIGFFALFSLFLVPASVSATIACGECTAEYCRVCQEEWRRISAQGIERRVVNASDSIDLFVPIKEDSADWDNFRDKYATGGLPSDFIVAPSVCGNGKYWDESILWWNNPTEDLACSPTPCGSYSGQEDEKHACSEGTYQSSTGQTSCVPASAGYRVAAAAACSQTACTPGNYQNLTGQTNCKTASAGYHVSGSAAVSQTPCNNGTYQSNTGQSSCLNCPTCRWSGQQAATSCYVVESGEDPGNDCTAAGWSCNGSCARTRAAGYCDGAGACATETALCSSGTVCSGGSCSSSVYCSTGSWSCTASNCARQRTVTQCNNSGVCNNSSTETVNCSSGQACSGGSCSSSYYCDEGSWSCDGNCSRTLARLQCSAGSCNVDAGVVDHCATGTTCTNGSCSGEANCGSAVTYCGSNPCAVSTWYPQCSGSGTCSSDHAATTSSTCPAGTNCYELGGVGACSSLMGATACPYTDQCVGDCGRQRVRYMCDGSGPSASACTQHYSTDSLSGCGDLKYCDGGVCFGGYYNTYTTCINQCRVGLYGQHCGNTDTLIENQVCTGGACEAVDGIGGSGSPASCSSVSCTIQKPLRCVDQCSWYYHDVYCSSAGNCNVEVPWQTPHVNCVDACRAGGWARGGQCHSNPDEYLCWCWIRDSEIIESCL